MSNKNQRNSLREITQKFRNVTKEPEQFLSAQPTQCQEIKTLLNDIYSFTYKNDSSNKNKGDILRNLYLNGLDEEQVWQQLELRNNAIWSGLIEKTSKLLSLRDSKLEIPVEDPDQESSSEDSDSEDFDGDDEGIDDDENIEEENEDFENSETYDEDSDDSHSKSGVSIMKKVKIIPSVVDDKFFKLSEMEAFLKAEDDKENRKLRGEREENDIDYFNGNFTDEDEENAVYKEFFADDENIKKDRKKEKVQFKEDSESDDGDDLDEEVEDYIENEEMESGEEDEDESEDNDADVVANGKDYIQNDGSDENEKKDDKPKSSFELRQERLKERIQQYEEEVLGEKPWQLKGEISSTARPQNSLLEEILEFESTTRPAPIITEETTLRLEDIIKQRIKDQAWDDVERKVKPVHTPQEFRKQLVLDQEKSKVSLAQVYEKEFQSEINKLNPNHTDADEEEPKAHKLIKEMMRTLFVKLDALSNFHFTPKPIAPEARIVTNTPAIHMEEVAPVAVSDAKLLAPEEIRARTKGDIMGITERNRTDKNRERRKKKTKQRAIHNALEQKDLQKQKMGIQISKKEEQAKLLKSVTKNRNVEKMNVNTNESIKSSKSFFSQLQDKTSAAKRPKHSKPDKNTLSAKKLKL